MRALKLCTMLGLVLAVAGTSQAINLSYEEAGFGHVVGEAFGGLTPQGITIKIFDLDMGTLYTTPGGPLPPPGTIGPIGYSGVPSPAGEAAGAAALDGLPQAPAGSALPLAPYSNLMEDSWGIARVTTIVDNATGLKIWTPAVKGYELLVLFWGEQDIHIEPATFGGAPADRISGVNLHVDMYSAPLGTWGTVTSPAGPGARGPLNTYPGITSGTLELSTVSLPGFINGPGTGAGLATQFETVFDTGALSGKGDAFVEVTGGASAGQFDTDAISMNPLNVPLMPAGSDLAADMQLKFTTSPGPSGTGWLVLSNDPVLANFVVPEPTTVLAVLFGIGGLAGYVRRRRG